MLQLGQVAAFFKAGARTGAKLTFASPLTELDSFTAPRPITDTEPAVA